MKGLVSEFDSDQSEVSISYAVSFLESRGISEDAGGQLGPGDNCDIAMHFQSDCGRIVW